jgi:hypothetical protein
MLSVTSDSVKLVKVKVKVKLSLCLTKYKAMKVYWMSECIAPLIFWPRHSVVLKQAISSVSGTSIKVYETLPNMWYTEGLQKMRAIKLIYR